MLHGAQTRISAVHLVVFSSDAGRRLDGFQIGLKRDTQTVLIAADEQIGFHEFVAGPGPRLYSTWFDDTSAKWRSNQYAERNYFASLNEILPRNSAGALENISNITNRAIKHLAIEMKKS